MEKQKSSTIHVDFGTKQQLRKEFPMFTPKAAEKASRVFLVQKEWFDRFSEWLASDSLPPPGKIRNSRLFLDKKFNLNSKLHIDFEIVTCETFNKLVDVFGITTKVVKYYVLHPSTKKPVIIFEPINLEIETEEKLVKKVASKEWVIGEIKDQLCRNLEIESSEYEICDFETKKSISGHKTVGEIQVKHPGKLILQKKQSKPPLDDLFSKYKNYQLPCTIEVDLGSSSSSDDEYEVSTPPFRRPISNYNMANNYGRQTSFSKLTSSINSNSTRQTNLDSMSYKYKNNNIISPSPSKPFSSVSSSLVVKPCGLRNLGNTCFFNAAVQCLVRCQPLTNFILSSKCESQINMKNPLGTKGTFVLAYRRLLEEMLTSRSVISPSRLHSEIARHYPIFENYGQNDSQELVGAILDGLHEDLNQSSVARGNCSPVKISKDADSWELHLARNSSPILKIFHGNLFHRIECPICHHTRTVHDPFVFLSLPVTNSYLSRTKLSDCILNYSQSETLDAHNLWKCEKCNRDVQASNQIGIDKTSDILIIHLKRFQGQSYFMKKIETPVDYPDTLDTSTFSRNSSYNSTPSTYNLIGVVFHHGNLIGGHYTSAAMDPHTGKWYNFNDSTVTPISQGEAHSSQAYILFYQKSNA